MPYTGRTSLAAKQVCLGPVKLSNMCRFWFKKQDYSLLCATTFRNLQQPDLLQDRFDVGGKTRNIAIQFVLQQCCKTGCTFFCPFYRTFRGTSLGWFSNTRTGTSVDDGKARGEDTTSGAKFAPLPLVKSVVWFTRAVFNWRSRSVAKSAYSVLTLKVLFYRSLHRHGAQS